MRRIIIIRGVEDTGKTTKIKEIINWVKDNYSVNKVFEKNEHRDTLTILQIEKLKIGFNSSGDNLDEVEKIEQLKDDEGNYPDIIICASRTKGKPHEYFNENFGYSKGWFKVYHNVRKYDSIEEREKRDLRVIEEIKTRLIGLKKGIL